MGRTKEYSKILKFDLFFGGRRQQNVSFVVMVLSKCCQEIITKCSSFLEVTLYKADPLQKTN